jgi:putative ABC transport system substrate-binding protein
MILRHEFITLLGGAAAWPLAARAQQGDRVRRIGVLMGPYDENDPEAKLSYSAFTQSLAGLGWTDVPQRMNRALSGQFYSRCANAVGT